MKTSIGMLAGWIAAAASLSAGNTMAGSPGGTTDALLGTASLLVAADPSSAAVPVATDTRDKPQNASQLLHQARKAMAEGDLATADSLISAAEALGVEYGFLHLGDTPKKARSDLERMRAAAGGGLRPTTSHPSWLFSRLALTNKAPGRRSETPVTDPFAVRSGSSSAARVAGGDRGEPLVGDPIAELPGLGSEASPRTSLRLVPGTPPAATAALPGLGEAAFLPGFQPTDSARPLMSPGLTQLPPPLGATTDSALLQGSLIRLPATGADSGAAGPGARDGLAIPATQPEGTQAGGANNVDLLLQARRALASRDVRRSLRLVEQAKLLPRSYAPLDDTPEKVEAAIRQYQEVAEEPVQTDPQRRRKVRMLMGQAEALLQYQDYQAAEALAAKASQEKLTYSPFEARPQDLLRRIAAARQQANPSTDAPPPGIALAESSDGQAPSLAAKQEAMKLCRAARAALSAGQLAQAEALARRAEQLGVPDAAYARGEERPGLMLLEIRKASLAAGDRRADPATSRSGVRQASAQLVIPATGTSAAEHTASPAWYDASHDPTRNVFASAQGRRPPGGAAGLDLAQNTPTEAPPEPLPSVEPTPPATDADAQSGPALFARGEAALEAHDTQRAYEYYRQAAEHLDQFDPITRQRLQERLQLLSVPKAAGDRGLPSAGHEGAPLEGRAGSIVDQTAARQQALARQVYADIAQQASKARAMLPSDPKGALALMEEARQAVEVAGLEPSARQQLLQYVDRRVTELRQFIERNRGRITLQENNQRTRDQIDRQQDLKQEVQEKLALMVDDFNKKMHEQRYAEAEVVAKRAQELAPEEPVVQQLILQSKFVKQFLRNQALQGAKEQGMLAALDAVDQSSVPFNDLEPYRFPEVKRWEELSTFRSRLSREQGRRRSEKDLEIQRKLRTPVSLSFNNKPLSDALNYLANLAEVNLYLDPQGLAEEGIASDTPVTIDIRHEIMLKSALNLILEPLHLSYVIKDEVLKITSEQLRNGEVYPVTYNVADLVVPIPSFFPGDSGLAAAYHKALGNVGLGGPYGMTAPPLAVVASKDGKRGAGAINPGLLAQVSTPGRPATGVGNMPTGFGPGGLGGASQADFDSLIDLITATIEPTSWDAVGGPGSIAPFETNLSIVVSQTEAVHEQIVDLLEQLRRMQDLQVTIEVRFITLNDNFFERLGVDFDFDINDNIDRPFQVFGRADPTVSTTYTTDLTANTSPPRDVQDRDNTKSVTVGMALPGVFSSDLDIPFRQGSFQLAVPQFGGFAADAGAQVGFAILSDIEAFFFINAAQGDRRSNVLQAPKVTLFNGQSAYVADTSQSPFVISVVPVVGDFAAAQQPVIVVLSEGTFMTVQAVVSNDRRFVRLTVVPFFSKIGDVNTFQFTGSETTTTNTSAEGIQDVPNDNTKSSNASTVTRSGTTVQLPTFSSVSVTTTVSVPDGGTVLLGGIKRLSEGRNEFGVPMLDKLPYINRLFKNVGIGRETQSLMMMVTPRIIIQEEEEVAQTGYTRPP